MLELDGNEFFLQKNIIYCTQNCKQIVYLHNYSLKNVKGCYQKSVQISKVFCANFKNVYANFKSEN